jgi:CubicO group peptidase (beta-lactamase class C family)
MKTLKILFFLFFVASSLQAQVKVKEKAEQKLEQRITASDELTPVDDNRAKFDSLINGYANSGKFNGEVLVAQKGLIMYIRSAGYRDAEKKIMHKPDDIYQIGSITKQFTAAVIMQLQNEGRLSVNDKLSKYFSGLPDGDKITIEHLLTHTSGLYNYTDDTFLMKSDVTKHYSRDAMLAIFRGFKPDFEPGTKWNYSNTGYSMLGYIIEKVTGKPYERVMRERILQPLGMDQSGFDFTNLKAEAKSKGYYSLSEGTAVPAPTVDSTIAYAAGALYTTTRDLLKWERAIYSNKILPAASWQKIFTPYKNNYGYGWSVGKVFGKDFMAHGGGIHGFSSFIMRVPEDELVVIVLDNSSGSSSGIIARQMANIAMGKPFTVPQVRKELILDKSILESYVGEYQLSPEFSITITLDGNQLKAQATGQAEFPIFAESEKIFFYKVVEAKIEFLKDSNGKVTEMILHQGGRDIPGEKIK